VAVALLRVVVELVVTDLALLVKVAVVELPLKTHSSLIMELITQ
jgi:hypothetical protein